MRAAPFVLSGRSESVYDGLATGRDHGPPLMRRHRAPARVDARRGGAGRRPAAVSDKELSDDGGHLDLAADIG